MAIRTRRGVYRDFDPSKMVSGEYATVTSGDPNTTSGQAAYVSASGGTVKRLAFVEDIQSEVYSLTDDISDQINQRIANNVNTAQTAASNAAASANQAANHITVFTDSNSDGNIVITIGGA